MLKPGLNSCLAPATQYVHFLCIISEAQLHVFSLLSISHAASYALLQVKLYLNGIIYACIRRYVINGISVEHKQISN